MTEPVLNQASGPASEPASSRLSPRQAFEAGLSTLAHAESSKFEFQQEGQKHLGFSVRYDARNATYVVILEDRERVKLYFKGADEKWHRITERVVLPIGRDIGAVYPGGQFEFCLPSNEHVNTDSVVVAKRFLSCAALEEAAKLARDGREIQIGRGRFGLVDPALDPDHGVLRFDPIIQSWRYTNNSPKGTFFYSADGSLHKLVAGQSVNLYVDDLLFFAGLTNAMLKIPQFEDVELPSEAIIAQVTGNLPPVPDCELEPEPMTLSADKILAFLSASQDQQALVQTGAGLVACASQRGGVPYDNQDGLVVVERPNGNVALISIDAVGGHDGATFAKEFFGRRLAALIKEGLEVEKALCRIQVEMVRQWQRHMAAPEKWHGPRPGADMQVCFAMAEIDPKRKQAQIIWCGDERALVVRDRALVFVSQEMNEANQLVLEGKLTPVEAFFHDRRHILTTSFGLAGGAALDLKANLSKKTVNLDVGDFIILGSDGPFDNATPEVLAAESGSQSSPYRLLNWFMRRVEEIVQMAGFKRDNRNYAMCKFAPASKDLAA